MPGKSNARSASVAGRRILALGPALVESVQDGLKGAVLQPGEIGQLVELAGRGFDLVLVDGDAWGQPELAAAVQAMSGFPDGPPMLLVGTSLPAGLVRNVLRLPHGDVLEAPFTPDQIRAAIVALLTDAAPAPTSSGESRCWAVTGAVGGAGATTIAIEVATALGALSRKERSVCLVDLNLADGAAAAYLGAQPIKRLVDLGNAPERIDWSVLQALVVPVSKQVDLLAGVRDATAFDVISRESVLKVLDVACDGYDWVILDVSRHRRSWTLDALAGCDEVLVVSELTVPALLAARAYADEIESALGTGLKPRIVLNRLATRMFGPSPSMAEAEKALQRKAEAGVSSDWEAAAASVNLGGPIAQHRPKSKIVKDIETMVARLASQPRRDTAKAA